jgi:hypothetical protein
MCKEESNMIFLQIRNKNKTRLSQKNVRKTCVEHIKGDEEFYFYLYLLGS